VDETLYRTIRDDIMLAWNQRWARPDIPVYWRSGGPQPRVDPMQQPNFLRCETTFARQELVGFGMGMGANFRFQRGTVVLRSFSSRTTDTETTGLKVIGEATKVFRDYRVTDSVGGDLSFVGANSGFDWGPTEDGVWFMRGYRVSFEYRFYG
jgi:hypothetical protein